MPPTTATPMPQRAPAPAPLAKARGRQPMMAVKAVMRIGRRRSLDAMTTASIGSMPLSTRSLANSTMRMAFLAAKPMIMMTPICM